MYSWRAGIFSGAWVDAGESYHDAERVGGGIGRRGVAKRVGWNRPRFSGYRVRIRGRVRPPYRLFFAGNQLASVRSTASKSRRRSAFMISPRLFGIREIDIGFATVGRF